MHYLLYGRTDPDAPTLVLCSGLGGAAAFWTPQQAALGEHFRVLAYDQAGTGLSPAELPEDYSIAHMADELLALLTKLGIRRCHFIGHALGGLVGLQLCLTHPALIERLVVINGWAGPNPHTARCFATRLALLRHTGPAAYLHAQPLFLYPPGWIASHHLRLQREEAEHLQHFPPPTNVERRIQALLSFDIRDQLAGLRTPTLVLANRDDSLVPWSASAQLAEGLPNARLEILDYGAHACTVTMPMPVNALLCDYLNEAEAAL